MQLIRPVQVSMRNSRASCLTSAYRPLKALSKRHMTMTKPPNRTAWPIRRLFCSFEAASASTGSNLLEVLADAASDGFSSLPDRAWTL